MSREDARLMLRLPADLAVQVRRLAAYDGRSLNGELYVAVREFVERRTREIGEAGGKLGQD